LVAPIALYPDALVAQVLAASTNPDQVAFADDWLHQNSNLTGAALAQAVDQQSWDPSVKALTQFPSVMDTLAKNLPWTSSLGQAYENQQAEVMAAVQAMRAKAQAAGRPALVDFTADWCLTCQVNKKIAIEIPSVRKKLKEINAVALVGDYTHFPDSITAELNRFNRAGVPLVLVYPKNPDAQPIILPQILTPGIVLDALDQATR
jgi:thiol:disulfide interchange protein